MRVERTKARRVENIARPTPSVTSHKKTAKVLNELAGSILNLGVILSEVSNRKINKRVADKLLTIRERVLKDLGAPEDIASIRKDGNAVMHIANELGLSIKDTIKILDFNL